jgi:hypothetical protein
VRGSLAALDRLAILCAQAAQRSQPQGNATINELPVVGTPASTDLLAIYRNGATYQTTMAGVKAFTNANLAPTLGIYSVVNYGATGNGTTDDTTAIKAAITAASAAGGGIVFFPAGKYLVSSSLTLSSGLSFWGVGWGNAAGSIIKPSFSGDLFSNLAAAPVNGLTFFNFTVAPTITQTAGAIFRLDAATNVRIDSIQTTGCYDWLSLGNATTDNTNEIFVSNCTAGGVGGGGGVVARYCFNLKGIGGGFNFRDCLFFGSVNALGASSISRALNMVSGAVCSPMTMTNIDFEAMAYGIYLAGTIANLSFDNIILDAVSLGSCVSYDASSPAYTPNDISFENCWFTSVCTTVSTVLFEAMSESYPVVQLHFSNCTIAGQDITTAYTPALLLAGAVWDVTINGCMILGGPAGYDIYLQVGVGLTMQNISISGNLFGYASVSVSRSVPILANDSGGTLKNLAITGNTLVNYTTAPVSLIETYSMSGVTIVGNESSITTLPVAYSGTITAFRVSGNTGFNPVGKVTAPTVASGTIASPFPYECTAYITATGACVVSVSTPISASATVATLASGNILAVKVSPGASITMSTTNYTWVWVAE